MGMNSTDFPTPWIALSPSNLETGCMTMISGSHKQEIHKHEDTFAEHNILTRGQVIPEVDESKGVDLILEPGEMSIHNGAIIHGSKPNKSQQRRIGFSLQSYHVTGYRAGWWVGISGPIFEESEDKTVMD